ncbi:hypothetical protein AnigIFM63604_008946 [Aspergillus niger]|uniref:Uncharacterized protein n=1 Tax=Aspergillus niger TaxID=5061 RepID=A0A9W5ZTG5_ASPNG|nr:hypothetical protein AnigIFM63326_002797 [Aspergillus niger]GLA46159.1 hypothetical protein AnigIFM63604_008946 [Aspergillus niger]
MVRSRSLKFWQRHAIWKLWRIWTEEKTKGAILADSVGLGKIIEGLESILTTEPKDSSRWRTVPCAWGFEIVDESDDLIRPTMEDFDRLEKVVKWLDAPEYQVDNHVEARSQYSVL